jgi:hypothetical protein
VTDVLLFVLACIAALMALVLLAREMWRHGFHAGRQEVLRQMFDVSEPDRPRRTAPLQYEPDEHGDLPL